VAGSIARATRSATSWTLDAVAVAVVAATARDRMVVGFIVTRRDVLWKNIVVS
jgi:hypothetical protein